MTLHRIRFSFPMILIAIANALVIGQARAATETATFQVTATVPSQCTTLTTNALAFGTYDPTSATATDASATLSIKCSQGAAITVDLNAGTTAGATVAQRKLASGANTLNYNLYTSAARTTVWGGANTVSGTGQGLDTATSFTVHGRIAAGQTQAAPGSYSDTITVTVSY
ncbi:MAG: spore coat U domain-containing protein [Burkholderiaceae bacterium]